MFTSKVLASSVVDNNTLKMQLFAHPTASPALQGDLHMRGSRCDHERGCRHLTCTPSLTRRNAPKKLHCIYCSLYSAIHCINFNLSTILTRLSSTLSGIVAMKAFTAFAVVFLLAAAAPTYAANNWARVAAEGLATDFYQLFQSLMDVADDPAAPTVADLAQHAPGNMSILINAVDRADLQTVIANPDFTATIFCPTNNAFRLALLKLKITPAQLYADKTTLTNILSYHVVTDQALAVADLKDGQKLTTVSQKELTVKVDKVAGTSIEGADGTAQVLAGDIRAGKSIIHIIDTVLLPPKPTT